jgi:zinc/manganese transport system permease protein
MFSSFMINSWIVASIVAVVAGVIGLFVVIRGSTFAAHALPLGTFPGAAAAALININELWGLIVFSGLGVLGISTLSRHQRNDVATALTLVTLLGLGTLFLSLSSEYSQSVYALLFGEVLGVSSSEIAPVAALGAITIGLTLLLFRPLLLTSVAADLGEVRGVRSAGIELAFLATVGLATAMALPVVGALLVFSLMVGPASAARLLTDRPLRAMWLSAGIAVAMVWASLALSYMTNWPVGFFVGSLAALLYGLGRCWAWLRNKSRNALAGA